MAEKLRKEVEKKNLLSPSQTGFRRGTVDNIYVLNYFINKEVNGRTRKILVLFVDLRATFDSMDRELLIEVD